MPVVAFTVMVFVVMGLLVIAMGSMVTAISAMVMVAAFIAAMATPLIGLDTSAFIAVMATLPIGHDTTAMVTVGVMAMVVAVAGRPEVMRSGEVSASPFENPGLTSTRSSASPPGTVAQLCPLPTPPRSQLAALEPAYPAHQSAFEFSEGGVTESL
jgi:hypothetical protein